MTEKFDTGLPWEAERYELYEMSAYRFQLARRQFFKVLGSGVVLVLACGSVRSWQESGRGRRRPAALPQEIAAWLHIGKDGTVTAYTGKVEVGQNIRTSLSQAVAEELGAPLASIRLVMGDTELTPFDMGTFGSRTTPVMAAQLRRVAAAARRLLVELASQRWGVAPDALVVVDGKVDCPSKNESSSFGELTEGRKLMRAVSAEVPLTPAREWKVAGHSVLKVEGRDFVTGKHRYTSDLRRPGMLYGKILRPPSFGAWLASLNTSRAESLPGILVVKDGDFAGVVAPSPQQANRALRALRAEWKTSPQYSSRELFERLRRAAEEDGSTAPALQLQGSMEDGLRAADQKHQATYTVAFIAHAPLEPRAAVAEWNEGKLTVWTGTQRPFGVRGELAQAFRIPEERVRVMVPDTGSGYGGKHTGEAAVEAARLARATGKPVKLVWTREEEFSWAYFRPAGVIEVSSGVRKDGKLVAWEFHNYNSGASAIRTPYDVPHRKIQFHRSESPLRQGSYRALAATANHFARETHMDELALLVEIDPLQFRLHNLSDARLRAVLEAAAERFGWAGRQNQPGRGFGIAGGVEKGSYVATCAEVLVGKEGQVQVVRLVTAFECGAVVNPEHLKNQVEGAVVMGLGGALFEAIEFENGRIVNDRFSRYRVPRFGDTPALETVLLDRQDLPSAGAGETPIVAVAPALGNAIFNATGKRLRSLPLAPQGVRG